MKKMNKDVPFMQNMYVNNPLLHYSVRDLYMIECTCNNSLHVISQQSPVTAAACTSFTIQFVTEKLRAYFVLNLPRGSLM